MDFGNYTDIKIVYNSAIYGEAHLLTNSQSKLFTEIEEIGYEIIQLETSVTPPGVTKSDSAKGRTTTTTTYGKRKPRGLQGVLNDSRLK